MPDARLRAALEETSRRIHAIAEIHRLLYESPDLSQVDMKAYVERLFRSLAAVYLAQPDQVRCTVEGTPLRLDLRRAVPVGLILNELMSNAFKHAFPRARQGTVSLGLRSADGFIELHVVDDGVGFSNDAPRGSLGLELVRILTEQLNGTVHFSTDGGTHARVRFPERPHEDV